MLQTRIILLLLTTFIVSCNRIHQNSSLEELFSNTDTIHLTSSKDLMEWTDEEIVWQDSSLVKVASLLDQYSRKSNDLKYDLFWAKKKKKAMIEYFDNNVKTEGLTDKQKCDIVLYLIKKAYYPMTHGATMSALVGYGVERSILYYQIIQATKDELLHSSNPKEVLNEIKQWDSFYGALMDYRIKLLYFDALGGGSGTQVVVWIINNSILSVRLMDLQSRHKDMESPNSLSEAEELFSEAILKKPHKETDTYWIDDYKKYLEDYEALLKQSPVVNEAARKWMDGRKFIDDECNAYIIEKLAKAFSDKTEF